MTPTPHSPDHPEAGGTGDKILARRELTSYAFSGLCWLATACCVVILLVLVGAILHQGWSRLTWGLLTNLPHYKAEKAGIAAALISSLWLIGLTGLISIPIGVGAAVYLEEYAPPSRLRMLIQLNISNLAGVPSIVYGILGLGLFVRTLQMGATLWSGALTMALVVLPIVILATSEALRAVPRSIRHGSLALGATRWQTVWRQVLPAATPGIMTGTILAISRALGEAAPLVAVGAAVTAPIPQSPGDDYSGLPLIIFYWSDHAKHAFHELAGAAIIVLLGVLVLLNATAVIVRYRFSKSTRW